ncbi:MAG: tetratricopeptide repeat protein [Bacteroidales bacterium]|nr:tetratricopeptide repeat protein [Bacteroidales bacterium]
MRILIVGFILTACFLSFSLIRAQDQRIADSLTTIYYRQIPSDDSAHLMLLYDLAYYHPNPDSALKFSNQLINTARDKSNPLFIYRGLLQKGHALRLKGDFENAAQVLFDCASEAYKMDYHRGVGCAFTALGDLYMSTEDHKNSLLYYNRAIAIFKDQNDSTRLANVLFNAGSEYLFINQLDSALNYFNISERIYRYLNNPTGIAYCYGNKGLAYLRQDNSRLAEKNLLKAIELLKELGDMYPIAKYHLGLSEIYGDNGDYRRALSHAHESYDLADSYGLLQNLSSASRMLSELYSLTGDYKKAFEYQIEYISYRDSIINEEKIIQMANMRTEFEVAQKQTEVDLFKKKKQTQTIISMGLGVIILLTGALICVLYANNKRKIQINKQLEEQKEELRTQRDQLADLNQTKDRFFSIISHDLRGPMNSLHGFSVILKEYIAEGNVADLGELTDELNQAINKVSSLLDNLLSWALNQQGRFPFSPGKIRLAEIMDETVMSLTTMALAKNISIVNEVEDDLVIWADKNSMMTVFRNLINNAVKFSQRDSTIKVTGNKANARALVKIKDNGVGIPREKMKDIFRLKGDKSTWGTESEKGVGLGLSLAYDFVRMNKGEIMVESKVNKGTTFIVKLPLNKDQDNG